jgi:hypothetical protein
MTSHAGVGAGGRVRPGVSDTSPVMVSMDVISCKGIPNIEKKVKAK